MPAATPKESERVCPEPGGASCPNAWPPGPRSLALRLATAFAVLLVAGCARAPEPPECASLVAELRPLMTAQWSDAAAADGLFGTLKAVRLAIERQLVSHDEWTRLGWCEYRAENFQAADRAFAEALARVRHSPNAALGRGYIELRLARPGEAVRWFGEALDGDARSEGAAEGLRLAVERLPDNDPAAGAAAALIRQLLESRPADRALLYAQATAQRKAGGSGEFRLGQASPRSATPAYFARTGRDYLELREPGGDWQPLFVKGVNIGPARPGRFATEAPRDEATWREWLDEIAALGANTVRVYTLQPPAFYRALAAHNAEAGGPRLWLMQGVWATLPPGDDFDEPAYLQAFQDEIARVIDAVHGELVLSAERGHAQGVFDADVSAYTLAWIVGREWEPFAVVAYDALNPGACRYAGEFVAVQEGRAMECWIGRSLDFAAGYEARRHGQARPLTFANWPTLDPLAHPTEANRAEEDAWRLALEGIPVPEYADPAWDDDAIAVDATRLSGTRKLGAGVFASYHVYPNFPYFMNLEPTFAEAADEMGVNRYAGYLQALKAYHGEQPVLIAEFGMSTSRGIAHLQPEGLHHGGHHEPEAMRQNARLARSIHASGMAGGIVFEFMDEWFKSTWSSAPFEVPADRRPYWFNAQSPEQSYGLWANRPAAPVGLVGDPQDWAGVAVLARPAEAAGESRASGASGDWSRLRALRATYDAGYLYVLLETDGRGTIDWSRVAFALGIDTYAAERGERSLPAPVACQTASGVEFLVQLQGADDSALRVTPPYLPRHPGQLGATRTIYSPLEPVGRFELPTLVTNRARYTRDGTPIAARQVETGRLRFGSLDADSPRFDTRSDVVVGTEAGMIEIRLPWALLNFGDPSSSRVLHQVEPADDFATVQSEGLRLYACAWNPAEPERASRLPGDGRLAALLPLQPWTLPDYRFAPKDGLEEFARTLRALPAVPRSGPDPERELDSR